MSDTNIYNKPAFECHLKLAEQIENFKPDMVFYAEHPYFMFFLKGGKLYIGKSDHQLQPLDYILPADEFIKKNPLFIQELHDNRFLRLKHYKKLKLIKEI